MANIIISELRPAGSELFQDSESFLNELTDQEMVGIAGGEKYKFRSIFTVTRFRRNVVSIKGSYVANSKDNYVATVIKVGC